MRQATHATPNRLHHHLDQHRYLLAHNTLAALLGSMAGVWHSALDRKVTGPDREELTALKRGLDDLFAADLRHVREGFYPRDLLFQFPIEDYIKLTPRGVVEMARIFTRRRKGAYQDLPHGEPLDEYPRYYTRNFHWQTDGWLSERSARYYDLSVEFLFGGTADIMRRMTIPPLVRAVEHIARPRILDIACGTGRFLAQLHAALPSARLYGLDLSPYYIQFARRQLGDIPNLSFLTENAEAIPLGDDTIDAATSVFLFHELPRDVRRAVMREALRILKPGGHFVVNDSAQLDTADLAPSLERFPVLYHEPYYKSYLRDDLADVMTEVGFDVIHKQTRFLSKVVVGVKP